MTRQRFPTPMGAKVATAPSWLRSHGRLPIVLALVLLLAGAALAAGGTLSVVGANDDLDAATAALVDQEDARDAAADALESTKTGLEHQHRRLERSVASAETELEMTRSDLEAEVAAAQDQVVRANERLEAARSRLPAAVDGARSMISVADEYLAQSQRLAAVMSRYAAAAAANNFDAWNAAAAEDDAAMNACNDALGRLRTAYDEYR